MKYSIIIPTLNEERYLPKLLDSIKNQNLGDYEIIVADNDSKDKTRSIAQKYGCTIVKGGIPSVARNRGARIAKGEYLFFIDADAVLPNKNFIESALKEFNKRKFVGATSRSLPLSRERRYRLIFLAWDWWNIICQYFYPQASGFFILTPKKHHEAIKGFDETIYFGEDSNYSYRMSKIGKFGILRSVRILISARRFEKKGFWETSFKMIIGGACRVILDEDRTNRINYFD